MLDNKSISKELKEKVVLISGAAGSIKSEIARQIMVFSPNKISILEQEENPLHYLKLETESTFTTTKIRTVIGDVRNREAMDAIFETYRPQVVYHTEA